MNNMNNNKIREINEIREIARKRYEEKQKKEDEERVKVLEKETEREIDKEINEANHSYLYKQFDEWDRLNDEYYDDPIVTLHLYYSITMNPRFMKLLKDYNRLDELQERVVKLVHFLNDRDLSSRFNLYEIREMADIMEKIIVIAEVDIPIEVMDTSDDEHLSKKLHDELNFNVDAYEKYEEEKKEKVEEEEKAIEILASVSLSSTRVGLRLPAMRLMAKSNGLSASGTKSELAIRLAEAGLVQLI